MRARLLMRSARGLYARIQSAGRRVHGGPHGQSASQFHTPSFARRDAPAGLRLWARVNHGGPDRVIAPGQVEGIDIEPGQIAMARTYASERGASNVGFRVASIYDLPFTTGSFDAVFAHPFIQHLRNPVQALTEMR